MKIAKRFFQKLTLTLHRRRRKPEYFRLVMLRDNPQNEDSLNFDQGIVLSKWRDAAYLLKHRENNDIEETVRRKGAWAPHLLELSDTLLTGQAPGIVLDIGANIGAFSIPIAKKHFEREFWLFEPHPIVAGDLKDNVQLNHLKNCIIKQFAVSDSGEQTTEFYAQENQRNMGLSSLLPNFNLGEHKTIPVAVASIDQLLSHTDQNVNLIKIDTQGTELDVLRSARRTIEQNKPPIIFELEGDDFFGNHANSIRQELSNFFSGLNYQTFAITSRTNYMPKLDLTKFYAGDVLALPNSK